jgi:isopenicillin-N N-acyltransferase like protein
VIREFVSKPAGPYERGLEFGTVHAAQIAATAASYRIMFDGMAERPVPLDDLGAQAFTAIEGWAPDLAAEIKGIADGAGLPVTEVAAINARTEILATLLAPPRGECSAAVVLGEPTVAGQTWDWVGAMADNWLVWTIPHPSGRVVHTVTEYGIVGKIGVNSERLGLLFTFLSHQRDGATIGVPVHVVARRVLDEAYDLSSATSLLTTPAVSASTSVTLIAPGSAITAELHPGGPAWVLPDDDGILVHTNHFLDPTAAAGDQIPREFPDTLLRHYALHRRLHAGEPMWQAMADHSGGSKSVCCHVPASADLPGWEQQTLATIELHVESGDLTVHAGGPCSSAPPGRSTEHRRVAVEP